MTSDSEVPISKTAGSGPKGFSPNAISVAIARDVLRRVREGTLPSREPKAESL